MMNSVKLLTFSELTSCGRSFLSIAWSETEIIDGCYHHLICGSEGGQIFIWRICIGAEDFSNEPLTKLQVGSDEDDVSAICMEKGTASDPRGCYVACGSTISHLDLTPTINSSLPPGLTGSWDFCDDDVNWLAISENGQFLAAADDTGEIKLIQLKPAVKVLRTLRKHTTICSAVLFRPRRPSSLLSASMDSTIVVWEDFIKCRVGQVIKMQDVCKVANAREAERLGEAAPGQSAYTVNPPLVHCVAVSPSGNTLVAGNEDSSLQVFDASKKTVIYETSPSKLHSKGVCQVTFLNDSVFISGGNDGRIVIWRLAMKETSQLPTQPASAVQPAEDEASVKQDNDSVTSKRGKKTKSARKTGSGAKPVSASQSKRPTLELVVEFVRQIQHGEPINWLSSINIRDTDVEGDSLKAAIAVADSSSSDISIYRISV